MLLTIVVPIYNVEKYLSDFFECFDNLKINSDAMEVIFIDDGSTDTSNLLVQQFIIQHSALNARLIRTPNGGLSKARNTGLSMASGEYIWFVDSDDVLDFRWLRDVLQILASFSIDVVQIGVSQFNDGSRPVFSEAKPKFDEISARKLFNDLANSRVENYAVGHIVRTSIYRNFKQFFPEGRDFEDIATTYKLLASAETCVQTPYPLYWYRQRDDSIVHYATVKSINDVLLSAQEIFEADLPFSSNDKCELVLRVLRLAYSRLFDVRHSNREVKKIELQIRKQYLTISGEVSLKLSLKSRIVRLLLRIRVYGTLIQIRKLQSRLKQRLR